MNECTPGTTECLAGGVASCATGANGCATWGVPVACGTGETPCDAGFVNDQGKFVLACTQQPDAAASCACLCQAGPACEH